MPADRAVESSPVIARGRQAHGWPAHAAIQVSARRKQRIAPRLDFETPPVHAPEQFVVAVHFAGARVEAVAHLVSRREHNGSVQRLHGPALLDELLREPVEQRRVRGPLAERAEVARGAHEAGAEVMLPEAVHHHARGERVLRVRDGAGQFEPPAAALERLDLAAGQHGQERPWRDVARRVLVAAQQHRDVGGLRAFLERVRERILRRRVLLEPFLLGLQLRHARA